MVNAKSWVPLTTNEKILIVNALIQFARTINNRYESQMYRKLAKKIVYSDGLIGLDGHEMSIIAFAMNQEAESCAMDSFARMYRRMAQELVQQKKRFHGEVYEELSARYLYPRE